MITKQSAWLYVLMKETVNNTVFWDVTPCDLVDFSEVSTTLSSGHPL